MRFKILVCYFRDVIIRPSSDIYFNIQCGKEYSHIDLEMTGDNIGDNISSRNPSWSEITGLYWAWRNIHNLDYIGLCSYRRFFNFKKNALSAVRIRPLECNDEINRIKIPEISKILTDYDVIVPKPMYYAYSIRKIWSMNYKEKDFAILKAAVHSLSPDYDKAFYSAFYSSNKMIGHNMFIMSGKMFDEYCNWVFPILFEVEKRIDSTDYPINQRRVLGYMHEILLFVYLKKNNFRIYYSQITWLTDNAKEFKFNNVLYKCAAEISFHIRQLLFKPNN